MRKSSGFKGYVPLTKSQLEVHQYGILSLVDLKSSHVGVDKNDNIKYFDLRANKTDTNLKIIKKIN